MDTEDTDDDLDIPLATYVKQITSIPRIEVVGNSPLPSVQKILSSIPSSSSLQVEGACNQHDQAYPLPNRQTNPSTLPANPLLQTEGACNQHDQAYPLPNRQTNPPTLPANPLLRTEDFQELMRPDEAQPCQSFLCKEEIFAACHRVNTY
eukprot:XP_011666768.1 PREDICTED: uncharacterized protein LOC105439450 isoform X1 [Strongylocentrotus purpuratus]